MRSRSLLTARLTLRILQTLGLSAALPLAACGGNVTVQGEGGGGGGTGEGGGGAEPCVLDVDDGEKLKHVCLPECPPPGEESAAVAAVVEWDSCDEFCCTTVSMSGGPCNPVMENGQCCYDVTTRSEEICMGRPFFVEGSVRVAGAAARGDWALDCAPRAGELDPATRRALAAAWLGDGLFEHASIASFARFTLELLAVGAPPELVSAAQGAGRDEIAHARACFGLASAYGGEAVGPAALRVGSGAVRATLADIAEAAAEEGCVGETLSALCAREALAGARDPAARAALAVIAEDEEAHAALAWRFVAWALAQGDAETNRRVRRVFDEVRAGIDLEPAASAIEPGPGVDPAAFRAHGRLSSGERAAVLRRGLAEVVRPCAAKLLAAAAKEGLPAAAVVSC